MQSRFQASCARHREVVLSALFRLCCEDLKNEFIDAELESDNENEDVEENEEYIGGIETDTEQVKLEELWRKEMRKQNLKGFDDIQDTVNFLRDQSESEWIPWAICFVLLFALGLVKIRN